MCAKTDDPMSWSEFTRWCDASAMCPAVRQQVGTPRADKDAVTDRYRSSLLSPVVRRVLGDPQLSLSSLSCIFVSRRFSVARFSALRVPVSIDGYLSRPSGRTSCSRRRWSAGTKGRSTAVLAVEGTVLGCLRDRRRSMTAVRSQSWRHATPSRRDLPPSTVTASRPFSPGAACQAAAPSDHRDIGQIFATIC